MDSAVNYINFAHQRTNDGLRTGMREQVETVIQMSNTQHPTPNT
jgi:hypothetical protein